MATEGKRTFADLSDGIPADDNGTPGAIDPAAFAGAGGGSEGESGSGSAGIGEIRYNKDGSIAKRRGRKPGAGNSGASSGSRKNAGTSVSVNGIEKILLSLHMMGASALNTPELMLDDSEAKMLAEGIAGVQEFYSYAPSAETIAWANLIAASVAIYGPRAVTVYNNRQKQKKEKPARPAPAGNSEYQSALHSIMYPG